MIMIGWLIGGFFVAAGVVVVLGWILERLFAFLLDMDRSSRR